MEISQIYEVFEFLTWPRTTPPVLSEKVKQKKVKALSMWEKSILNKNKKGYAVRDDLAKLSFILKGSVFLVAYLEPSRTSTLNLFCKNSWKPLTIFAKNSPHRYSTRFELRLCFYKRAWSLSFRESILLVLRHLPEFRL